MDVTDINTINTFLSGTAVAIITIGLTALNRGIRSLNEKVGAQNNRVGKLETWLDKHEKQDDLRHKENREDMAALWGKMDGE